VHAYDAQLAERVRRAAAASAHDELPRIYDEAFAKRG
jgi:hypothetical protein